MTRLCLHHIRFPTVVEWYTCHLQRLETYQRLVLLCRLAIVQRIRLWLELIDRLDLAHKNLKNRRNILEIKVSTIINHSKSKNTNTFYQTKCNRMFHSSKYNRSQFCMSLMHTQRDSNPLKMNGTWLTIKAWLINWSGFPVQMNKTGYKWRCLLPKVGILLAWEQGRRPSRDGWMLRERRITSYGTMRGE